jgi:hypothetical protein
MPREILRSASLRSPQAEADGLPENGSAQDDAIAKIQTKPLPHPEFTTARRNSFPVAGNSYKSRKFMPTYFQGLTNGTPLATKLADEVARNGVLQRITSARGFL